jgi:urea transporter
MNKVLVKWEDWCASSKLLRFVDINLRGIGQVMFQNNPASGALFLAGVAWGSIATGAPYILLAGIVAVVVATLTAQWLHFAEENIAAGLYGYNAVLVGLALATFLAPGPLLWVYVVLGASVSVVVTRGTAQTVSGWGSALTFPFVLTTWFLLLSTYGFAGLADKALPDANLVTPFASVAATRVSVEAFVQGVLRSISQVFLKGESIAALFLLAGLAVSSLAAAAFALGGAIIAVITAHLFGAESDLILGGLKGFSPLLTAIALGTVFYKPCWRVVVYAGLATVFTVIAQAALNVALSPLAIPALTAPFVVVSWLFLLPRQCFESMKIPDAEKKSGAR